MGSVQRRLRYGIALLAGIVAAAHAVGAIQEWRQYGQWLQLDPSAANAYLTLARVDAAAAAYSLGIALLAWLLLRPGGRGPAAGPRTDPQRSPTHGAISGAPRI